MFRFLAELTTWIVLIVAGYWYVTIASVLVFALVNFNGDKKPKDAEMAGVYVKGWIRIAVELGFGLIGCGVSIYYFNNILSVILCAIILVSFFLDRERWLWMLGKRDDAPPYVIYVHK
jgi:hypothetical protein